MLELEIVREKIQSKYRVVKTDEDLEWNRAIDLCTNIINAHLSCENAAETARSSRDNDGWIPVDERLPEEGTQVIVTTEDGMVYGDIVYGYADETDSDPCFHRWDDEYWKCFKPIVIAWHPHPKPYSPDHKAEKPDWRQNMLRKFDRLL